MREFLTLFKYEFKMQTPFFRKKGKLDILGALYVLLIMAVIVVAGVFFLSKVLSNYLLVEIDKVYEPIERAKEILTLLYFAVVIFITFLTLERTRKVFADDVNKLIFLRLPLKKRNVFLSKFAVISLHAFLVTSAFVLTINIVLATILPLPIEFWFVTLAVCILMPIISLLLNVIFIVPYVRIIEFLSDKYVVLVILFTAILVGAFFFYAQFLSVVQTLLTTGSIRFLFNEDLVATLQGMYIYCYPTNLFVKVLLDNNVLVPWLFLILVTAVSVSLVYFISKSLYQITLHSQPRKNAPLRIPSKIKQKNTVFSLVIKEFICVLREPKHVFAYFSISMSMPIMVYCCFSLFQTLILNTLGFTANFALALSTVLIFAVLTNTFCATNVTRDGLGILKMKTLPISVYKILFSKVLFCAIVSSIAVVISCVFLTIVSSLPFIDCLICIVIGLTFTLAQIFIATKLDLTHAKISMSDLEVEDQSSKTLAKVVLLGGVLTLVTSATCVFFALFASGTQIAGNATLLNVLTYLIPSLIGIIYLICSAFYFRTNIEKCFKKLSNK